MISTKTILKTLSATAVAAALAAPVQAADEVNVAFFLEWATPNMIAKAEGAYEDAMGVKVNWTNFDAGTQMTEAMLAGDIDISYSQGLAPFITAVNANAPIKTVGIAVTYPANPCVVANDSGITKDNASELEGKSVAVPLATMADYSFRMQMRALEVDLDQLTIVDQVPADGAVSLADGSVVMACLFGGDSIKKAQEHGTDLMSAADADAAGIVSFDVVSVTEKFAQENPELVQAFMDATDEINKSWETDQSKLDLIMKESGMDKDTTMNQMESMGFPTNAEQLSSYFNEGGLAATAFGIVGGAFATDENPAREDYSAVIDTSFLK
ncbi:taurine ABC transporter substrate-binding protein [Chromatiales bacterium (ex Bugula neritina AB1)]|nr:taurine ABC transporter substrate-binding protein [Chromatiales bacterium (ex Bugula neritina AB1)]